MQCHCNGVVFKLGQRNPKIIAATNMAMDMWDMGNHHLISAPRALLGARLAELLMKMTEAANSFVVTKMPGFNIQPITKLSRK